MALLDNLTPLAPLLGTWKGEGSGEYPTIDSFTYTEELAFTDVGKPFLLYVQKTWSPSGAPMHTETGYLRLPAPGVIEMILAQPTGQTELLEGTIEENADGFQITLQSTVVNSATAKTVDATERKYSLTNGGAQLSTTFAMAAVGVPMTHHLGSTLTIK